MQSVNPANTEYASCHAGSKETADHSIGHNSRVHLSHPLCTNNTAFGRTPTIFEVVTRTNLPCSASNRPGVSWLTFVCFNVLFTSQKYKLMLMSLGLKRAINSLLCIENFNSTI